ncbi:NADP-dependent oxidoreductase [Cryobacterium psychrophilum]|uniref:NADP-dependent oxidoreductase n=1 Tax=Cryobacterium psychrophilum TaxID=41988 RepID=A0A4Y8KRT1_9MICO|nr:NADP-dependent oxidoreductase [Cryobacterium psychrophilum]TDW28663.1 NADPH:quinone reductase-like Zn-dependent oxidoreductase [Cryobacterium psychrophilum]TFD82324.1 NADP-dependent oxidoreductase [Cryobacterium psychrophilum]
MSPRRSSALRAVSVTAFGGVDTLEIIETERPQPGPGEVLVEVLAAGINHVEAFLRQGRYQNEFPVELPIGQGSDFAGLVVATGEGVTSFTKGSEVLGHTSMASHATFVVVPATSLVAKPAALSWEVAGSLFLAGFAANDAVQAVGVGQGDVVVISAAAGGVGSIEAHLAMARGATVIGTCGERNFDYLRQIGVKPVVYGDGLAERIRAVAPGGVAAYLDNFGKDNIDVSDELGVSRSRFRSSENRRDVELRAMAPSPEDAVAQTRVLARIAGFAADRTVNVLISGFYPFDRVREAFDDLEKHHARGKIVLGMRPVDDSFHGFGYRKVRDVHERS